MSSDRWPAPERDGADPLPRRNLMLTGVFLAVVAAGLVGAWLFQEDDGTADLAAIGERAPDFEVEDVVGGEPILLSELVTEGRPIVLNLMASWCAPCREEIPELNAFADDNPEVMVLGVAVEDAYGDFKIFVAEVQPTYRVGFDEGDMRAAYQTLGLPATFFIDSDGTIVDLFNGILDQEILEQRVAELFS